EDPQETYSTSEHLFQDLGIPHDAKGRLIPAPPREPKAQTKPREQRGGGSRGNQSNDGQSRGTGSRSTESRSTESRDGQPKQRQRNRSRSRTRSGAPVAKND
ncbi:MAG: ATP-dependent helicase, partial [Propionibacteriales bacterium]|nr:ATP-dependent helicase [Propionibacteriales bacterium]